MKRVIDLRLTRVPDLPLEADRLRPDSLAQAGLDELYALPLLYGNQTVAAGEFLRGEIQETEEGASGVTLILRGDFKRVKRLGQGMQSGELIIEGPCGFHTGAEMGGGRITIRGDAGDWLGAHMTGGVIRVEGNAGHWVGASYRGKTQGMRGGAVIIHGNAGRMTGTKMRGGLIVVRGDCLEFPGYDMNAGTILIAGRSGRHIGSGMVRGTIIVRDGHSLLPTFYHNCAYKPSFWPLLRSYIEAQGLVLDGWGADCFFDRYSGEALTGCKGEVLLCHTA
ncbi:MAG: formylmethanofuran dehydrogenase subunit C [Synergistaceae bacterium]|jgi:formylmethanofuran dehydrogenase subunit C|nr:formylmethanofuran dehydrogenase subunit C [Synergistaceae bacterium]